MRILISHGTVVSATGAAEADVLVDDEKIVAVATHHMNVDYSAYEGFEIRGRVVTTLSRGRVVIDDGEYLGSSGHGKFLARGLNQYLV